MILKRESSLAHLVVQTVTGESMTDLRYPIGKFHYDGPLSPEQQQIGLERHCHHAYEAARGDQGTCRRLNSIHRIDPMAGPSVRSCITYPTAT